MPPIRNIGNLPPEFRRAERNQKQAELDKAAENAKNSKAASAQNTTKGQDQVNVSDSARTLLQRDAEIQRYTAEIPSIETLSAEQKQEIEAKIQTGFYASPEVAQDIAGKMAEEPGAENKTEGVSPTRFQEVIQKIREGQYDANEVLDVISERILKDL